jgi:hypothetical protein
MQLPFSEYAARVQRHLEVHYRIPVVTRDIPDPLTGDLDGVEIHIDHAVSPDLRLFLLAHLFGHTVQWNVDEHAFDLGIQIIPPVDEAIIPKVLVYEKEAARYGVALLHEAGITDADSWFSRFSACDLAYLTHFYRTGETGDFESFWQDAVPAVEPIPIPSFTPARHRFRMDGIVI